VSPFRRQAVTRNEKIGAARRSLRRSPILGGALPQKSASDDSAIITEIKAMSMTDTFTSLANRYAHYSTTQIPTCLFDQDDMYEGRIENYLDIGRSAINLIFRAMLAADVHAVGSILDLPSGAGRVTRHLRAFFPEAALFVCDIAQEKARYAAAQFDAEFMEPSPTFSRPSSRQFDLIFTGSLLTHLDEKLVRAALDWICFALAPNGLSVITTGGRMQMIAGRSIKDDLQWERTYRGVLDKGFNFFPLVNPLCGTVPYGSTHLTPAWLMKALERNDNFRVVAFQEAGWAGHQDAIAIQKRPISLRSAPSF
jgi:SAM-dependent methyltransferase